MALAARSWTPEPLCATEVDAIAAQAVRYGSEGFVKLPHKLLDSPAWRALAPPAHDIILMAFRRYVGNSDEYIALTPADFAGREGFGTGRTFYRHRNAAIASGILVLVCEGGMTQTGRKPDLFAIAPQWHHDASAKYQKDTMRKVSKRHPYIDKQAVGFSGTASIALGSDGAGGREPNPKTEKAA